AHRRPQAGADAALLRARHPRARRVPPAGRGAVAGAVGQREQHLRRPGEPGRGPQAPLGSEVRGGAAPLLGALLASAALAQVPRAPPRPPPVAAAATATARPDRSTFAPEGPDEPADGPRPQVTSVELRVPPGAAVPPDVKVDVRAGQPLSLREARR